MAISKTFNNTTYSIPTLRKESGWETTLSVYLQALADNAATTTFNKQAVRKATTTPVTVSGSTDCTIIVDLAVAGATTVNLPAGADKQIFVIVDGRGDASTNNITVDANGSETIEGSLTKVIRLNRECLALQYSSSAGEWKVIGGYVPDMIGGPASATDNAIARFDGTTGKLVQNSGVEIDDSGNIKMSYSSSALGRINYQAASGDKVFLLQTITSTNNYGIGVDSSNLVTFGSVSGADTWNVKAIQYSSSGAVTLGPSGGTAAHTINGNGNSIVATAGNNLILKKSTGASMSIWADTTGSSNTYSIDNNSGLMRFYNHGGTVNGSISQAGEWTLGPASGLTTGHTVRTNAAVGTSAITVLKNTGADSSSNYFMVFNTDIATAGYIWNDASGNLAILTASDANLKENIRNADYGLNEVLSLRPVTYDWRSGAAQNVKGFIAQEVEPILPYSVTTMPDGHKGVSTGEFIPVLVKAIQEQQAIIDGLKARLEALENP
jgi:hypothetical protein